MWPWFPLSGCIGLSIILWMDITLSEISYRPVILIDWIPARSPSILSNSNSNGCHRLRILKTILRVAKGEFVQEQDMWSHEVHVPHSREAMWMIGTNFSKSSRFPSRPQAWDYRTIAECVAGQERLRRLFQALWYYDTCSGGMILLARGPGSSKLKKCAIAKIL